MSKRFYISFNTKEFKPNIMAVAVELKQELIRDMDAKMPINLAEHPLYKELWTYCKNNPPR